MRSETNTNTTVSPSGQDIKIDNEDLIKNTKDLKELEARLNSIASYASLQTDLVDQ